MKHTGWIASLSNGETAFETPPVPGQISSWQSLLRRLQQEHIGITQMRLQKNGTTVIAVPKADGYVHAYEYSKAVFSGREMQIQGIGSVFGDVVFMTWMNDTGQVWQDIRELSVLRVHSTIDWQT